MDSEAKALRAAELAEERKAADIQVMDVRSVCSFADYFVVCTGHSDLQLQAIGEAIEHGLKEQGIPPYAMEGRGLGSWMVLDYGDVVIHIMCETSRSYYALERLWGDARIVRRPGDSSESSLSLSRGVNIPEVTPSP